MDEAKIMPKTNKRDPFDVLNAAITPYLNYQVFDYETGKSLTVENNFDVVVKRKEWKESRYPEQYYELEDSDFKYTWYQNKEKSTSFTVKYPKNYKNVCVGIGFINESDVALENDPKYLDYDEGKIKYGKSGYYKKGKDTMSYMRLNK